MSKIFLSPEYEAFSSELGQVCERLNLTLTDLQRQQLLYYLQQLLFWNKAYNLTAIKDPKQALIKHIFDSLAVISHLPSGNLLDVGTGAGLPAVIIAICQPERVVVALDSNSKKIRFIKQITSELGLKNITPIACRIEEHADKYAVITSRAFASLVDFVSVVQDRLAENGQILAMKGQSPSDEIAILQKDWKITTKKLLVPTLSEERHLIILEK